MKRARSPDEVRKARKALGFRRKILGLEVFLWLVISVILVLELTVWKNRTIVERHYSGWQSMVWTTIGLLIVVSGITIGTIMKNRKFARENGLIEEKEPIAAKNSTKEKTQRIPLETPEGVYEYVSQVMFDEDLQKQLDQMNKYQARLEKLLEMNRAEESLKEAKDLLQAIEDAICLNVRKLINVAILVEDNWKSRCGKRRELTISDNQKLLETAEELLFDLAEFINGGKGDSGAILGKIKDYRDTIKEFLEEEEDEDGSEEDAHGTDDYFPTLRTHSMR